MVELHYEDEQIRQLPDGSEDTYTVHWRVVVNDERAALAQAGQDLAEGRNPIRIVERPPVDPWDYRADYDPRNWKTLVARAAVHERARAIGPAIGG